MSWTLHAPVLLELLYTLAKEKLSMSTFTKTLIASAMAIAVAGPAAADVPNGPGDRYEDGRATVKITPSGCKNAKLEFQATVGFGDILEDDGFEVDATPFAGCWAMTGFAFGDLGFATGGRIARKVDNSSSDSRGDAKDLTMSLSADTLYDGVVDAMDNYLEFDADGAKCDYVGNGIGEDGALMIAEYAVVKKANGKFSKNQEKLKVDIQVDSKYENTKGKMKNIKASIKANLDAATGENPAFDCGAFFVQPI